MSAPMPPEQRRSELVALRAALADAHARLHTSEIQRDAWTDAAQRAMKALAAAQEEIARLTNLKNLYMKELDKWSERECEVCPEDASFENVIKFERTRAEQAEADLATTRAESADIGELKASRNAERVRITKLEQSIRDLLDCLVELAHPEDGWPAVHIADTFERSRRLVSALTPKADA